MCFNAEVSLKTFIFGSICAGITVLLGHYEYLKILVVFSFTLMQLLEYYTWNYINDKRKIRELSILGLHLIAFQLILMNIAFPRGNTRLILLTLLFIFFIAFYLFQYHKTNFDMEKGKNGHLIWYWADVPPIWIIIALLFYLVPCLLSNYNTRYLLFSFGLVSVVISLYYYFKYKTWGTIWCYLSNLLWFYLIITSVIFKLKQ